MVRKWGYIGYLLALMLVASPASAKLKVVEAGFYNRTDHTFVFSAHCSPITTPKKGDTWTLLPHQAKERSFTSHIRYYGVFPGCDVDVRDAEKESVLFTFHFTFKDVLAEVSVDTVDAHAVAASQLTYRTNDRGITPKFYIENKVAEPEPK